MFKFATKLDTDSLYTRSFIVNATVRQYTPSLNYVWPVTETWKGRWEKCVRSEKDYFEGE